MRATLGPSCRAAIRFVAFVVRCTAAAMLAYVAANEAGLGHPVWAVVSALIVSQETAHETRTSFTWRVVGTLLGTGVAVLAALLLMPDPARPLLATGVGVAVCAVAARRWPLMRVCLWTAPLVILTVTTEHGILRTAVQRCSEVLLGGAIGAVIHLILECVVVRIGVRVRP